VPLLNSIQQMSVQLLREIAPEYFRHDSLAVKSHRHGRFQTNNFRRIIRCRQPICQLTQFLARQLPTASQANRELDHFGLFRWRQLLNFLDNRGGCHDGTLNHTVSFGKFPHHENLPKNPRLLFLAGGLLGRHSLRLSLAGAARLGVFL
jgi:hypothetical protein